MFAALMPILNSRDLLIIASRLDNGLLSVTISPKRITDTESPGLSKPLTLTGSAEEIDTALQTGIPTYVQAHTTLSEIVTTTAAEIAAYEAEVRASAKQKMSKGKAPADKPTPVKKPEPPKPVAALALFDTPTDTKAPVVAQPTSSSDDDEGEGEGDNTESTEEDFEL